MESWWAGHFWYHGRSSSSKTLYKSWLLVWVVCISSQYWDLSGIKLKPILKGILAGLVTIAAYLLIVVITTPALPPSSAIQAAFLLNWLIISLMSIGVGLQTFLSSYGKMLGCRLYVNKKSLGGNAGGAAASSFFSFFSLIPLGCCGWWLYAISFLPSIFGVGFSTILINYSQEFSYLGVIVIFVFNAITAYTLSTEKKSKKLAWNRN